MLIQSSRHSIQDLALWQEYALADACNAKSAKLEAKERTAIESIESFVAKYPDCTASTSWGKDSVVLCHLLWRSARQVPLMHLRPTNHNPDCDLVRDVYLERFSHGQYDEVPVDYSSVDRTRLTASEIDKATDYIWYESIKAYNQGRRYLLGVRADESTARKIRMLSYGVESKVSLLPIGYWKTSDVFAYLSKYDLPIHPAYACLGGGRWDRMHLRVAEIGDTNGSGMGRTEWESEYYPESLNRGLVSPQVASRVAPN